jgi:hypothetical protein
VVCGDGVGDDCRRLSPCTLGGTFNREAGNPGVLKGDSALELVEVDLTPLAVGDRDLGEVCTDETYYQSRSHAQWQSSKRKSARGDMWYLSLAPD